MKLPRFRVLVMAAITAAGCAPEPAAAPTYYGDVQRIIAANCARCHGADPAEAKIARFRLDRYVERDARFNLFDYRDQVLHQAVERSTPPMPPDYALTERQRTILSRWIAAGGPAGREARPNHVAQAALLAPALPASGPLTVDQSLVLTLRSWDEDPDGLLVDLYARSLDGPMPGESFLLAEGLGGGVRTVTLDTGTLPSLRSFELVALVDDGFEEDVARAAVSVTLVPTLLADHGAKGTVPSVLVTIPAVDVAQLSPVTVAWRATDPDVGDEAALLIDLERIKVAADGTALEAPVVIRSGLPNTLAAPLAPDAPTSTGSFAWDASALPTMDASGPIRYRLRVTAHDPQGNVRSDESDGMVSIVPPPTTVSTVGWDDVKPVFVTFCRPCHGQPARTPALEPFRLDKYDAADPEAPSNGDKGVFEMRSQVYDRLVVARSMPPTREAQPSAAQIKLVGDWIASGAPRTGMTMVGDGGVPPDGGVVPDGGGSNLPPTVSWTTPSNTATAPASGGAVTLVWTARDPELQPLTGQISFATVSAMSVAQVRCQMVASFPGIVTADAAAIAAGTFMWTLPAPTPNTYFCVRAQVTDAGGLTTSAVAAKPVVP
ncbi:MAG: hypothetical protein IT370_01360 [Deltaproteobacteria bacterium]|nr:hypothetical protein [Deltaproteobacteria bacterium]